MSPPADQTHQGQGHHSASVRLSRHNLHFSVHGGANFVSDRAGQGIVRRHHDLFPQDHHRRVGYSGDIDHFDIIHPRDRGQHQQHLDHIADIDNSDEDNVFELDLCPKSPPRLINNSHMDHAGPSTHQLETPVDLSNAKLAAHHQHERLQRSQLKDERLFDQHGPLKEERMFEQHAPLKEERLFEQDYHYHQHHSASQRPPHSVPQALHFMGLSQQQQQSHHPAASGVTVGIPDQSHGELGCHTHTTCTAFFLQS